MTGTQLSANELLITVPADGLMAMTLWSALNLGLMLLLALNVFRWRAKENIGVDTGDSIRLLRRERPGNTNRRQITDRPSQ